MSVLANFYAVLETLLDVLAYFRPFNCRISASDVGIDYFLCRILDSLGRIGLFQTLSLPY